MSASEMPSGRNRLPGMGAMSPAPGPAPPSPTPAAAPTAESVGSSVPAPRKPRTRRPTSTSSNPAAAASSAPSAGAIDGPYLGEPKMQVNPRIYASIWSYYEELVDQLPRPQRRGALTALVNAVLVQHAPASADDALKLIGELRQAEARQRPS